MKSPSFSGNARSETLRSASPAKVESTMESSFSLQNPSKQWRYTWESFAHIPTLRLYLFPSAASAANPSLRCRDLSAAFRPELSLLVVRFSDSVAGGDEVLLRVRLPKVLFDPDSSVECSAKDDHIEVKLALLLPVDHPVIADLLGKDKDLERFTPLSLNSDLKALSTEGVNFFCKTCSTKLTREPLRHFVEMPSMNWQEAADNWFGACCCSFGGISEKLVSQYVKTYACKEGTCLLDAASIIISKEDLENYPFQHSSDESSDTSHGAELVVNDDFTTTKKDSITKDSGEDTVEACEASTNGLVNLKSKTSNHELNLCHHNMENNSLSCSVLPSRSCCGSHAMLTSCNRDGFQCRDTLSSLQTGIDLSSLKLDPSTCLQNHEKSHVDYCGCNGCSVDAATICSIPNGILLRNNLLGSCFMVRTSNLSNDIEWVEFKCKNCLSLLGAYPSYRNRYSSIDGGIRLFKCYISTSPSVGSSNDIFRKYTMQRLFVNLLLENAVDELSFRTIVRDMKTKDQMLQIVLLNSKAWCTTGYCLENCDTLNRLGADLQPIVKVLFSVCAYWNGKPRMIEDCSATARSNVEEVYMMPCQITELVHHLNAALDSLPSSCSSFQGMSVSSLER